MIKLLSVILSLVILVLSAVSCNDADDMAIQQTQTLTIGADHTVVAGFDICNPFFFCHTGHSAFVQSENFVMEFISTPVRMASEKLIFVNIPVYSPVWHPPKA